MDGQEDGHKCRWIDEQKEGETNRDGNRHADGQKDRRTDRQAD